MLRCLTSSLLQFEEKISAEKIILFYVGKGNGGMATAICFLVCPNRMLDYWTPSGRQSHQRVDSGGEEPGQRAWTVEPDYQEAEEEPHIGEATIRDTMIHKKSFLVLDWPLRAVNSKGSTKTFQMMVNEQGWTNIEERSYYGSSEQVSSPNDTLNIISRLQKLDKLIAERRRRDLPMSCTFACRSMIGCA